MRHNLRLFSMKQQISLKTKYQKPLASSAYVNVPAKAAMSDVPFAPLLSENQSATKRHIKSQSGIFQQY